MRRALVVLVLTVYTLIVLEIVLRLLWTPPELNPRFRRRDIQWMQKNVVYNSYGYRDREYSQEKPAGVFRIYSLGDSYTFGWYLPDPEKTYPKLLEKSLNDQHIPTEVINAASPGFSVKEEVNRFLSDGRQFSPDLVTIGVNFGDFVTVRPFPSIIPPYSAMLNRSYMYRATIGALVKRIESQRRYTFLMDIFQNSNSQDWQEFARLMLRLNKSANSINARLAIILFPYLDPQNPDQPYPWQPMHKRLEEFTRQHGITLVDPLGLYLAHPDKRKLVLNPIDAHPTEDVHPMVVRQFLASFDVDAYRKTHVPYVPTTVSASVRGLSDRIRPHRDILSVSSNNTVLPWVFLERGEDKGMKTIPLRDLAFRQSPIYLDELEIYDPASADQPGNSVGASIKYHVLAKNQKPGEIRIPVDLYGYPIVGLENIQALYVEKEGGTVKDYIRPQSITIANDSMVIRFDQKQQYYVYQLDLVAAVKQLTLDANDHVRRITRTETVTTPIPRETTTLVVPLSASTAGLPQFTESPGVNYPYAFIDGKFVALKDLQVSSQGLQLTFHQPVPAGSVLTISVSVEYTMKANETVTVQLEL